MAFTDIFCNYQSLKVRSVLVKIMIWIAISLQLILSAGLLLATWQVWTLRKTLTKTVNMINGWTKICEDGLQISSPGLEVARDGVGVARKQYQALQGQLGKVRNLLAVLGRGVSFVGSIWKQAGKGLSNSVSNKSSDSKSSGNKSLGSKHNVKRRR